MERPRLFNSNGLSIWEVAGRTGANSLRPGLSSLDVRHCGLPQPQPRCLNCFGVVRSSASATYVNMLDFSLYGGVPWPLCEGVSPPSRWFADLRYTIATPLTHSYPSVTRQVLCSSRVADTVSTIASAEDISVGRVQKRAVTFLYEMKARISKGICKIVAYILFKVFRRLMSHLLVCPAQMAKLQEAEKVGIPIVYLPLHRSHLDYLLTTWTLWHWDLRLPHIASGDNLNLSGFGWLLRATGAFFIRRRIGDDESSGSDSLYRSVLQSYLTELLRSGLSVEFFLEGTRSRFGKTLLPKNGLISNVISSVQQGLVKDVFLVPLSFTYDEIAEGTFIEELMGMRKQRESVWRVFKGIVQSFGSGKCGAVRLHFGVPVRLSDCMAALKSALDVEADGASGSDAAGAHCYRELLPWHRNDAPQATLVRAVGFHLIYEAQMQTSLSVGSVLSTLLLCKYRDGGEVHELSKAFEWLCDSFVDYGFDVVGWVYKETDGIFALKKGFAILKDGVFRRGSSFWLSACRADILRLAYYKNAVLPALAITSVVSLAVLFHLDSSSFTAPSAVDTALTLCDLLRYDVIFCKPCENLRAKLVEEISGERSRVAALLTSDGEDGCSFKISTYLWPAETVESILRFYANVLRPFLQSLYLMIRQLVSLKKPFEGRDIDFARCLLSSSNKEFDTPFSLLAEALNSDSLNSSLKLLRDKGLLVEGARIALRHVDKANTLLHSLEDVLCKSE